MKVMAMKTLPSDYWWCAEMHSLGPTEPSCWGLTRKVRTNRQNQGPEEPSEKPQRG
jgi:hypothetical protein